MRFTKKPVFIDLKMIFIVPFVVLLFTVLLSQLMLTIPEYRVLLSHTDRYNSVFVNSETTGFENGEIVLKLKNCKDNNKVRVLKNGVPIAIFYEDKISVPVTDNSLIEIDATKLDYGFGVELVSASEHIEKEYISKEIEANSNICILGRVLFK